MGKRFRVKEKYPIFTQGGYSNECKRFAKIDINLDRDLNLKKWARQMAKLQLRANIKIMTQRKIALDFLLNKYAMEDRINQTPLTVIEAILRAREWADVRSLYNPYHLKELQGIKEQFKMKTRISEYTEIEKNTNTPFRLTSEGIIVYDNSDTGIVSAMQVAQSLYGSFEVINGGDHFRFIIAAISIMLDIILKGEDMTWRVDELSSMITNEKKDILDTTKCIEYSPRHGLDRRMVLPLLKSHPPSIATCGSGEQSTN